MKARWEANFGGNNIGRIAVLGNGLTFDKVSITAVDAQLVDQARWTAEVICAVFHVPPYKIGLGVMPSYNNVQALNVEYFTQCLQVLIESAELCFDEGLEMSVGYDTKFDTDGLLRMDTPTQADVISKLVHGGVYMPNDGRAKFNLAKAPGGDHVYLQQQNYSLEALEKRDQSADPFASVRETFTGPNQSPPPTPIGDAKPSAKPSPAPEKIFIIKRDDDEEKSNTPSPPPNGKQLLANAISAKRFNRITANHVSNS